MGQAEGQAVKNMGQAEGQAVKNMGVCRPPALPCPALPCPAHSDSLSLASPHRWRGRSSAACRP